MATLQQSIDAASNLKGYVPVDKPSAQDGPPPDTSVNVMPRCPTPPLYHDAVSLGYHKRTNVPFRRIIPPPIYQNPAQSAGTLIQNIQIAGPQASASSSSSGTNTAQTTVSVTTAVLNPNQIFATALSAAHSFQLLSITATGASRIRLYGTGAAQIQDSGRAIDFPPPAGTVRNLISDLVLDTAPYQWDWQNRVGANADKPQTKLIYISVTQLGNLSSAITVTLAYVPLES